MKSILKYLWCFYLGGILMIANITIDNWKWWVITVPVVLLVALKDYLED